MRNLLRQRQCLRNGCKLMIAMANLFLSDYLGG